MATPPIEEASPLKPPAEPVILAASRLHPGTALDLACGSGRHAQWLVQHGWSVTAVDQNAAAIARIQQTHPSIDARTVDLESGLFRIAPDSWDLIVCWLYHQPDLYPAIRAGVRRGGIAALCALRYGRFAAEPGELLRAFPDWAVLYSAELERVSELIVQRS